MKLPFLDRSGGPPAITDPVLSAVLDELCDGRQSLLLATPYLQFEARFLERRGEELRLRVTLGRDAVKHVLTPHPLRLRFPWALRFHGASTQVLGYEQEENRRVLRVQTPDRLERDEPRKAYRVERVGHSSGAISAADGTILRVSLENLSALGAGVFVLEPIPEEHFRPGHQVDLSLSLDQGPALHCQGRLCHAEGQSLGLAFQPLPTGVPLEQLLQWLEPRELEAQVRWEERAELRAMAEQAARPKQPPAGILLLTSNQRLHTEVAGVLNEIQPVRAISPAMGPFKEARFQPPLLLLLDAAGASGEDRYRFRTLLEAVPLAGPLVVLGDGKDVEGLRLLALELKATMHLVWNPTQEVFFRRLIRGLIHQHWKAELDGL